MKLRQIINEGPTEDILKYFHGDFHAVITPSGYSINGDIKVNKNGLLLKELPWKIYGVKNMTMKFSTLRNLKNFPNIANTIDVSSNQYLMSLATTNPIGVSTEFIAKSLHKLKNLDGVKIHTGRLILSSCHNLKTVSGFEGKVRYLDISNCDSFEEDPKLIKNVEQVVITLDSRSKFPLIRSILFKHIEFPIITFESLNFELEHISKKYENQGIKGLVNLIRELNDMGYKERAKL